MTVPATSLALELRKVNCLVESTLRLGMPINGSYAME